MSAAAKKSRPQIDLVTHVRSAKSGQIIRKNPYRLYCTGQIKMFECPSGSLNWLYENGEKVPAELHPKDLKAFKITPLPHEAQEQLQKQADEVHGVKEELSATKEELSATKEAYELQKQINEKLMKRLEALEANVKPSIKKDAF